MEIKRLKGTYDILPGRIEEWQYVENVAKNIFNKYDFEEMRVPVIENVDLFARSSGETSDVVKKEMYTFEDKGGRKIALRPEGTAGIIRAYIENGMASMPSPLKVCYRMPMYRYDNVQKGRQREFNQIGCELLGSKSYEADVEIVELIEDLLNALNIKNFKLEVNSIGCKEDRAKYREALRNFVKPNLDKYCDDCKVRYEKNPLRILDCKVEKDKEMNEGAPEITDYLCDDCKAHFENFKKMLTSLGIEFTVNSRIVRGLDYYTKTVFEFTSNEDGLAILGGGRYDDLIQELGGVSTPAVGFAIGEERLLSLFEDCNEGKEFKNNPDLFIAYIGENANVYATKLARKLRDEGIKVEKDIMERSLKAQLKFADKKGAKFVVTIGDDEIASGKCKIKNMETGNQEEIEIDKISNYLK